MQGKKAGELFSTLMTVVLALAVLLIFIAIFFPHLFTFGDYFLKEQRGIRADADGDGLSDIFSDHCPCTFGEKLFSGCPADFTEAQRKADKAKYNSDTGCGVLIFQEDPNKPLPAEQGFQHYRSVELFGDDDGQENGKSTLRQACTRMVGRECPGEDNDCGNDDFSFEFLDSGCLIMISEDDDSLFDPNDCGQAKSPDGTIISLTEYHSVAGKEYFSVDKELDPQNLLSWQWKSRQEHGSLLCNRGFWFSCREDGEGKSLTVNSKPYFCRNQEWVEK